MAAAWYLCPLQQVFVTMLRGRIATAAWHLCSSKLYALRQASVGMVLSRARSRYFSHLAAQAESRLRELSARMNLQPISCQAKLYRFSLRLRFIQVPRFEECPAYSTIHALQPAYRYLVQNCSECAATAKWHTKWIWDSPQENRCETSALGEAELQAKAEP